MKNARITYLLIGVSLFLSGCSILAPNQDSAKPQRSETLSEQQLSPSPQVSQPSTSSSSPSPIPADTRAEVVWQDYDPGFQAEIDRLTTALDCRGISTFFGMAIATEESVKARTGHGNEALTKYLNEALVIAKCN